MDFTKVLNIIIISIAAGLMSSCVQSKYPNVQHSEFKHSSSDVIPLHESEVKEKSGGFLLWLLEGMLGSDPDDDLFSNDHKRHSSRDRENFTSKHGSELRGNLSDKKR